MPLFSARHHWSTLLHLSLPSRSEKPPTSPPHLASPQNLFLPAYYFKYEHDQSMKILHFPPIFPYLFIVFIIFPHSKASVLFKSTLSKDDTISHTVFPKFSVPCNVPSGIDTWASELGVLARTTPVHGPVHAEGPIQCFRAIHIDRSSFLLIF